MPEQKYLTILVEARVDQAFIEAFLNKIGIFRGVKVEYAGMSLDPSRGKNFKSILRMLSEPIIVVYDQEYGNVRDAASQDKKYYGAYGKGIIWCPAIPNIESWLLSDLKMSERLFGLSPDYILSESFPAGTRFTSRLFRDIFRNEANKEHGVSSSLSIRTIFDNFDPNMAISISPSLRNFIRTVGAIIGRREYTEGIFEKFEPRLDRTIFSSLLAEVYPSTRTVYKTADGHAFTAAEMQEQVLLGTEDGKRYIANVLRQARDMLMFDAED